MDDLFAMQSNWFTALAAGELSTADEDNVIGYAGYVFNRELRTYTVRYRMYDPELGRWLTRDPPATWMACCCTRT
jgi:RHS repeat-associated protein